MYKHPQRIHHSLPLARPPTAEEAASALLFSAIELPSGLRLAERTWVPAMVPWRATEQGIVTTEVLDWYARFAQGQPGTIVVEATGIRDVPSGPLLRIGHDRFIPGLRRLVDTVRRHSDGRTKLLIQIIDFLRIRRRPERERYLGEYLVITERHRDALSLADDGDIRVQLMACDDDQLARILSPREMEAMQFGARERVWDTHLEHIRMLPRALPDMFAQAAQRARRAGFDGVELHYAHAYTMASFLSRLNGRDDGYGGSRAARLRLPLEVLAAVRAKVGADYTVGCRMLCDEIIDGGSRIEDTMEYAVSFARAGMDFISLSTGGKFEDAKRPRVGQAAYPYTGESGWECMPTTIGDERAPFGRHVPKMARIRAAVRDAGHGTPVVICGGINNFDQAEGYLHQGAGDIVAAARQSLADPDWFAKLRSGRGDEIRRCIYRNYCEALDQKHRQVTCQLWDREGLTDADASLTDGGRRRLTAPRWR